MLRLERRPAPSRAMLWSTPLLAVALTVLTGAVLFVLMGYNPGKALWSFFISPLSTGYGLAELGLKATPLMLIGVGLAVGFRAGVWNIGADGQFVVGALLGGALGVWLYDGTSPLLLPAMCVLGVLGGMAWAAIPAFLKVRWDVNEILTSLMLTYVAQLLLSTLVYGPLKDPTAYNFPQSRFLSDAGTLPIIIEGTRLHVGFLVTLILVAALWVLLSRTLLGFEVKVLGAAPQAAAFAGFSRKRMIWLSLLLSGGLSGLAGIFEVAGPIGQLVPNVSPGYGFTAIIVAFLGRLHPLGIVGASFLMALSFIGGENAQVQVGLPQAVTGVFQGLLLFWVLACDVLITYRLIVGRRPAPVPQQG
jgi:simple sugar transport system permease protein